MIKAILKFCKVPEDMFLSKSMICSGKGVLHITKNGVDPFESRMFNSLFPATDDMHFMDAFCLNHGIKTLQTIRDNCASRINVAQASLFYLFVLKTSDFVKFHSLRMLLSIGFHGRNKRRFPFSATTSFTAAASAAKIGIVNLNTVKQYFIIVILKHYLHQFVFGAPGGIVGYAKLLGKFQGANAVFALGQ